MATDDVKPDALRAEVKQLVRRDSEATLVLAIHNSAPRALHYIADVRTTRYDPATRRLTLALSDEGREVIPGAIAKLPQFRHVDPGGSAELTLRVPLRIVKLSRNAPPGEIAFEQHALDDVDEIVVDVGWADVPYYKDTRRAARDDRRLPAARWEQHKAHTVQRLREGKPDAAR